MKKKNSATAALTASRWKKISKRKKRKRNPDCPLRRQASRHPLLRLPRPNPRHPPRAAAASPKRKRKPLRNQPRRKLQRKPPKNPQRRPRRRKARSAANQFVGREALPPTLRSNVKPRP